MENEVMATWDHMGQKITVNTRGTFRIVEDVDGHKGALCIIHLV